MFGLKPKWEAKREGVLVVEQAGVTKTFAGSRRSYGGGLCPDWFSCSCASWDGSAFRTRRVHLRRILSGRLRRPAWKRLARDWPWLTEIQQGWALWITRTSGSGPNES